MAEIPRLDIDFNAIEAGNRIRIGPAAQARNYAELRRAKRIMVDTCEADLQVLVEDGEGNTCEGMLLWVPGDGWRVVLDRSTWQDAKEPTK